MNNEKKYTGGCFCGKVRYYTIGDPVRTGTAFDLLKISAFTLNQKTKMNQDQMATNLNKINQFIIKRII